MQDWPEEAEERSFIEADCEGEWGDRRQELVFISSGRGISEATLCAALDDALLTDEELALGPQQWAQAFEDDFPEWGLLDGDGEDDHDHDHDHHHGGLL